MRSPNPASGLCGAVLAISALTHTPVTPILLLYRIDTAARAFVQENSMLTRGAWRTIRVAYGVLVPGLLRSSYIRREKSAETLEESVAVALQSARPVVSATDRCRGWPRIARERLAVLAPSAAATRESGSPVFPLVPGSRRNSAERLAVGSGLVPF